MTSLPDGALWYGWLAGTIAFAGTVTWVITAMHQFGQVPIVISAALMLLLATYLGLYMGLYAWGYARFQRTFPKLLWLGAPALWVSLEFLRTYALSGFPWALLGYSQYQWLSVIQFADVTGVYGVSFLVVMGNVALTSLLLWIYAKTRGVAIPLPWMSTASFALHSQFSPCLWLMEAAATGRSRRLGSHSVDWCGPSQY